MVFFAERKSEHEKDAGVSEYFKNKFFMFELL